MHTRMTSWHRNGFHINSLVPSRFLLQGHGHAITVLRMMMTSSHGNIFRVTGHLCGEFTGDRWIPRTKTSDAKLWYFLWSAPWINVCGWWFKTPMCSLWRHCSTPEGRAVSVTRELDLSLLCRIWLFGRHLVSLAKIAEVWPPFFFSDGNTRHCSRVYISRDLIWIKIVVGKTIYKQIVIILAIRFAVLSTVFRNNYSIKFVNWFYSMIAKSSFETSPKQPRTTWHHNAAGTSQVALWRHECDS